MGGGDCGRRGKWREAHPQPKKQETNNNEILGRVESGGGEIIAIGGMEGVVGEERLEFREEHVQRARKKEEEEGHRF